MDISKRTAQRMLENIDKQLEALAIEQQTLNNNSKGRRKMPNGGSVEDKLYLGNIPMYKPVGTRPTVYPAATQFTNAMNTIASNYIDGYTTDNANVIGYRPTSYNIPTYLNPNTKPYNGLTGINNPGMSYPYFNSTNWWNRVGVGSSNAKATNTKPVVTKPTGKKGTTNTTSTGSNNLNLDQFIADSTNAMKYTAPNFTNDIPTTAPIVDGGSKIKFSNPVDDPNSASFKSRGLDVKGKFNWGNAMSMAPMVFNAIQGLTTRKPDVLDPEEFQNPYESQAMAMMPDYFRIDDMLNDNRNSFNTYLHNVNQVGNSRGERMANYSAGVNRMNEANTKARVLKNNIENEMRSNKAQLRNNQGMARANTNLRVRDMNDANAAAARNNRASYLGAAASGLQNYQLTNQQMNNQYASQMAYINALNKMPHFNEWLNLQNLVNEYGKR